MRVYSYESTGVPLEPEVRPRRLIERLGKPKLLARLHLPGEWVPRRAAGSRCAVPLEEFTGATCPSRRVCALKHRGVGHPGIVVVDMSEDDVLDLHRVAGALPPPNATKACPLPPPDALSELLRLQDLFGDKMCTSRWLGAGAVEGAVVVVISRRVAAGWSTLMMRVPKREAAPVLYAVTLANASLVGTWWLFVWSSCRLFACVAGCARAWRE